MDPRTEVIALANECWVSRSLHVAATFNLADEVDGDGVRLDDLATGLDLDYRVLRTVVRVLSSRGIFAEVDGTVYHTEASLLLRSDHPSGVGDIVRWSGSKESWNALGQLPAVIRSGGSGFEAAFKERLFDYLADNEHPRNVFARSMEGYTRNQVASILSATDMSSYATIADIGGGSGLLANAIAAHYPAAEVLLFDLPGVVPAPQDKDRIEIVAGDFFTDAVPSADLTLLVNVLHDWSDEDVVRILKSVRRSLNAGGHLYIIEGLVAPNKPSADLLDLGMAVMTGGRQRAANDYRRLLSKTGFRLIEEIECSEHMSTLVAEPLLHAAAEP